MPLPLGAFERDCPQSNPRIPLDWTRLSPLVIEVFGSHHELDHEKEIDQPCTIAGARPMRRYTQCFSVIDFSNSQFDQRALTKRHMEACGGPLNRPKRSLYVYIYIYTYTHTHTYIQPLRSGPKPAPPVSQQQPQLPTAAFPGRRTGHVARRWATLVGRVHPVGPWQFGHRTPKKEKVHFSSFIAKQGDEEQLTPDCGG